MKPPSGRSYELQIVKNSLAAREYNEYLTRVASFVELSTIIHLLFQDKSPGFFIEAGAMDGEFLSNTLYLETEKGWTGLLVEPDNFFYKKLSLKNRKAWSINCCLSTKKYPFKVVLFLQNSFTFDSFVTAVSLQPAIRPVKNKKNSG